MVFRVIQRNVVFHEQSVDFHACFQLQEASDFGFRELAGAVSFDGEGFEGSPCGVLAGGGELSGEGVRGVEDHLHGFDDSASCDENLGVLTGQ